MSFELFARPALRQLTGHADALPGPGAGRGAAHAFARRPDGKLHFDRVRRRATRTAATSCERAGVQASNVLSGMAAANGLALLARRRRRRGRRPGARHAPRRARRPLSSLDSLASSRRSIALAAAAASSPSRVARRYGQWPGLPSDHRPRCAHPLSVAPACPRRPELACVGWVAILRCESTSRVDAPAQAPLPGTTPGASSRAGPRRATPKRWSSAADWSLRGMRLERPLGDIGPDTRTTGTRWLGPVAWLPASLSDQCWPADHCLPERSSDLVGSRRSLLELGGRAWLAKHGRVGRCQLSAVSRGRRPRRVTASRRRLAVSMRQPFAVPLVDALRPPGPGSADLDHRPLQLPLRLLHAGRGDGLAARATEVLTYEEIARVARVCVERFGFESIRLTGGEPLVRAHVTRLVEMLAPARRRPRAHHQRREAAPRSRTTSPHAGLRPRQRLARHAAPRPRSSR